MCRMTRDDEITVWIKQLGGGDEQAAEVIWKAYFEKLTRFARRKLEALPRRMADEEDVALSAMQSFCRAAAGGRFPQLNDRDDLWKLLVTITGRKAFAQFKYQKAAKRGNGQVRGESIFMREGDDEVDGGLGQVFGREPSPELAGMFAEDTARLLDSLEDESLRQVALLRLEGYSNDEIANQLGCVTRSVERKLERIRAKWSKESLE